LTRADVTALLPSALTRSAAEGARIVTLHWLLQLEQARADWAQASDDAGRDADAAHADASRTTSLHRARVALRRLRASIKTHRALLRGSHPTRLLNAMTRLQRATNAARDADVAAAWLTAELEALPEDARAQATGMVARLHAESDARRSRVAAAWKRHLDANVARAVTQLSSFRSLTRLGDGSPASFVSYLANTIERSTAELRDELESLAEVDEDHLPQALHHVRIQLKRQRALLSPHVGAHPALAAWYGLATRGQDVLGAMRDAALLGAHATYEGADALADVLRAVAAAHQDAFLDVWCRDLEGIRGAQRDAANALRTLSEPSSTTGLPMEYERKYLLTGCPPEAAAAASTRIDQGWIPGTTLRERLRRSLSADGTARYTRTIKLGPATARIEVEEDTDAALFHAMWPLTVDARIRKRRFVVPHGVHRWEIDVFLDRDLVVAEIELRHEHDPVELPAWLVPYVVRDVTGEVQYFNAVLAHAGGVAEHTTDAAT
jgi:CYTH domain-containing protein/CHAD domain-containing protein